ncbi:MAG: hypothetical protein KVP17_003705 [Porospora cf. gigantea B]|uniref:uncharacterized protein n=1 Tax=Porospora cf. gigantea B TaxID=2853592 RepID=UPI003571AABE|nr:MAG: hypothetical protein KVP17_003705 [Porospora cf. gigantea B]
MDSATTQLADVAETQVCTEGEQAETQVCAEGEQAETQVWTEGDQAETQVWTEGEEAAPSKRRRLVRDDTEDEEEANVEEETNVEEEAKEAEAALFGDDDDDNLFGDDVDDEPEQEAKTSEATPDKPDNALLIRKTPFIPRSSKMAVARLCPNLGFYPHPFNHESADLQEAQLLDRVKSREHPKFAEFAKKSLEPSAIRHRVMPNGSLESNAQLVVWDNKTVSIVVGGRYYFDAQMVREDSVLFQAIDGSADDQPEMLVQETTMNDKLVLRPTRLKAINRHHSERKTTMLATSAATAASERVLARQKRTTRGWERKESSQRGLSGSFLEG